MFRTLVLTLCVGQGAALAYLGEDASQPTPPVPHPGAAGSMSNGMTLAQAEARAIARSLTLVAARLELDQAEVEKVAAGLLENPEFSYQMQNVVLGDGNHDDAAFPSTFQQIIQTFEVRQVLDVWFKRRARVAAASAGIEQTRWQIEDVLREVRRSVQSAFVSVLREQQESDLAAQGRARYGETVALTRKRRAAGDISESELRKIELEQLKYVNNAISARAELVTARNDLARVMAYGDADALPQTMLDAAAPSLQMPPLPALLSMACEARPDLRAARLSRDRAALAVRAEKRSALPDVTVSGGYTHSKFQLSGDNPETLLFSVSVPLPVFDRNQAAVAAAGIEARNAANTVAALELTVQHDVRTAHVNLMRHREMLDTFEQGMLDGADRALAVAERSWRAGALSLLELLEAQRTWLETRAEYLQTMYDWHQAGFDLAYAVGRPL